MHKSDVIKFLVNSLEKNKTVMQGTEAIGGGGSDSFSFRFDHLNYPLPPRIETSDEEFRTIFLDLRFDHLKLHPPSRNGISHGRFQKLDFRFDHLKLLPPPTPELKLFIENFDIAETSLCTGMLLSRFVL